jgi:hypothetical protein
MAYSLSGHPAGANGVALLLLRVSAALTPYVAYQHAAGSPGYPWLVTASLAAGVLLVLGVGTRATALVCAIAAVVVGFEAGGWPAALLALAALDFGAIALLGAGAYSVDARLFGRRVIEVR